MPIAEIHLALLLDGPRHGYDIKHTVDSWFPDDKPLAFGQVYATLTRLVRDGLAEVVEIRSEGGPERTIYAITPAGRARLDVWQSEPAAPGRIPDQEVVRKIVVALHGSASSASAMNIADRQRDEHLRRMQDLQGAEGIDVAAQLARRHALLHLQADLRWLEEVVGVLRAPH